MSNDLYQEVLIDLARHPHGFGRMEVPHDVFAGTNASCGDEIQWYARFDESGQRLEALQWTGQGCIISQAAMSIVVDLVVGKTWAEASQLTEQDLETALGIEEISPGRIKCITLGLRTLLKNWAERTHQQESV